MGKLYEDWNKLFCDQLCEEIKKFEKCPSREQLHVIKELIEVTNGLQEMEMDGAIRRLAEDYYGYDSGTGRFREDGMHRFGRDAEMEFIELFNAARGRGRRRDSRGRFISNMGGPKPTIYYPPEPDEYPWEYPYYMMNDSRREYSGDRFERDGEKDGKRDGRKRDMSYPNGVDDDGMYMLRQENGRPIMTPYNMAHNIPKKLTDEQYEDWMENLQNEDGSDGPHWTKPQIEAEAKRAGIDISEYGIEAVWACTNFLYSDFCGVASKYNVSKPSFYINMALAFLDDKDYEGSNGGIQKLATYYHKIAKAE